MNFISRQMISVLSGRRWYCTIMLLLLGCGGATAQDVRLSATVQPENATIGQTIVYLVRLQTLTQNVSPPNPPVLDPAWGLSAPNFAGTTSQVNIVNGAASQSFEYRWYFTGSRAGKFVIPAASVQAAGKTYQSEPCTLTITPQPVNTKVKLPTQLEGKVTPPLIQGDPNLENELYGAIFILQDATTTSPYNGQQVRISYHLVLDPEVLGAKKLLATHPRQDRVKFPQLDQFLKEELYPFPNQALEFKEHSFGGKKYYTAPLYEVAITSTKTGKQTIDAFQLGLVFTGEMDPRSRGMITDQFGEDFFGMGLHQQLLGGGRRVRIIAQSPTIELDVKAPPTQGRPADFTGAVGDFKITAAVDKDKAVAHEDVVKLEVVVEGSGDASSLPAPKLPALNGFKQLGEPVSNTLGRKENDKFISTKKFEFALRPTQAGQLEIPPIAMSIFDPKGGAYKQITTQPAKVVVAPGTQQPIASQAPATVAPTETAAASEPPKAAPAENDLRYIHTGALAPEADDEIFNPHNPIFMVLTSLPPIMLLGGLILGRSRRAANGVSDRSRRQRKAAEVARRHLRLSEKLMNSPDRSGFYAELSRALRGYFGDKYGLNPSDLTVTQIEDRLTTNDAPEETISLASTLLDRCDAARYSPVHPDLETARAAYKDAELLLSQVESGK